MLTSADLFLWVYRYNKPKVFDQSDRAYYLILLKVIIREREREKKKKRSVQADSQGHVSHYHTSL